MTEHACLKLPETTAPIHRASACSAVEAAAVESVAGALAAEVVVASMRWGAAAFEDFAEQPRVRAAAATVTQIARIVTFLEKIVDMPEIMLTICRDVHNEREGDR
jgi:hypothetical protein